MNDDTHHLDVEDQGADAVTLLGRLLTSPSQRKAFDADREAWLDAASAEASSRALFIAIDVEGLRIQSDVLLKKRFAEVAENIPKTLKALEHQGPSLFETYAAESPWPKGHLRHLDDALAFVDWLHGVVPQSVFGVEVATLQAHTSFRKVAKRVTTTFVANKDVGPIAGYVVVAHFGARTWHAFLPTPVPASIVRWRWRRARKRKQLGSNPMLAPRS